MGKESYEVELSGEKVEITNDMLDVRIDAKEGFSVAMENNVFVILETAISDELMLEGLARELVSKVQQMRKAAADLNFEAAAQLRDKMIDLKKVLQDMD